MDIEYEATFPEIDKEDIRKKLREIGAQLIKKEFLQRRIAFDFPEGHKVRGGWLRIRDEGNKITMSLKIVDGKNIEDQKEICLEINNLEQGELFLTKLGCKRKAIQETKREIWKIDDVEICIDEWPFLEPFVEVEGKSEKSVKEVCEKLGFNYNDALFCSVDTLFNKKYGTSIDIINNHTPRIIFNEKNPFRNHK